MSELNINDMLEVIVIPKQTTKDRLRVCDKNCYAKISDPKADFHPASV